MPALRNRTMGIKVTDEEHERLERRAEARGLTMSDWGREVLLAELERGEEASPDTILAEVLGVRMLLLNTINRLLRGEGMTPEELRKADRPRRPGQIPQAGQDHRAAEDQEETATRRSQRQRITVDKTSTEDKTSTSPLFPPQK
jgi:hypothetical protein